MIDVIVQTEFGNYPQKMNHGYRVNHSYYCIDVYVFPEEDNLVEKGEWISCPCCNLKPKVWIFDNGRQTACGCGNNDYEHFAVHAESIMSVYKRTKSTAEYDSDQLRKNWNEYCMTMINPCSHADLRFEEKW